jgi:hypothetical protein
MTMINKNTIVRFMKIVAAIEIIIKKRLKKCRYQYVKEEGDDEL